MSSSSSSSSITLSSLLFKNTNTYNNFNIPTITNSIATPSTTPITNTKRNIKIHNKIMEDKKRYHVATSCNIFSDDSVAIPDTLIKTTTTTTTTTTPTRTTAVKSKSCESESMEIVKIDINKDERNNKRKFSESFKDITENEGVIINTNTDKEQFLNKKDSIELICKREKQIIEEENENSTKKIKINTKTEKDEMFEIFQPWALRTYGDQAKTKTITLKKKQRILKALDGKEHNNPDSSKFRFWVKSKGFTTKKPETFIDTERIIDLNITKDNRNLIREKDDIDLFVASTSKDFGERFYRKVAVVEEFFNIIFDVHVNLGGRSGRHAGQKRTYRIITETYAFLPREAVTKFLSGCPECKKNLRPFSPNRIDEQLTESSSEFETINLSILNESTSKPSNLPIKQLELSKKHKLEKDSELLKIDNRRFSEPPPKIPKIYNPEIDSRLSESISYSDDLGNKLSEFHANRFDSNSENFKVYNNLVNYYQFLSQFYNQQQSATVNWMPSPLNLVNSFSMSTKNILELRNFLNPMKTIKDYQMLKEIPTTSSYPSSHFFPISTNLNSQMTLTTEGKTFQKNSLINLSSDSNDLKISSPNHHHHYQLNVKPTTIQKDISSDVSINITEDSFKKSPYICDAMTASNLHSSNIYKPEAIEISPEIIVVSSSSGSRSCSDSDDNDDDVSRQTCAINLSKKFLETTKISKCDVNTDVIDLKINKKNADDDDDDNKQDRNDKKQMSVEAVDEINRQVNVKQTEDDEDGNENDFKPITSTYLKLTRSMGLSDEDALKIDDLTFR